jgi:endonuclease/exonuclease/phosphatase family metal-dependent hydrolase
MSEEIKILTYNIFLRPYMIKSNEDDHKESRMRFIVDMIKEYQIVCLQEVFDNFTHRRNSFLELAFEIGFKYFAKCPAPSFCEPALIDGGVLILSKFPIEFSECRN